MRVIPAAHERLIHRRRTRVLAERIAALLPSGASILDVGCGDGLVAELLGQARPDLELVGIDVTIRRSVGIPVTPFDGRSIPFATGSFDAAIVVDVVHHAADPVGLLTEAARVAENALVVKDHTSDAWLAHPRLRLMDRVANGPRGIACTYDYWPRHKWLAVFETLGLRCASWSTDLGLYPPVADLVFGRSLHFVAKLEHGTA